MNTRSRKALHPLHRGRAKRAAGFAKARNRLLNTRRVAAKAVKAIAEEAIMAARQPAGYDPELLYVECGRCGAPVLWEEGRTTKLLSQAGIDPLELDASCMLVTDACPACGSGGEYGVRIFRITERSAFGQPPGYGNA